MLTSPLLTAVPGVAHGFSTRLGPRGADLDLGVGAGPADWAWVAERVGLPGAPVALISQVHGDSVVRAYGGGAAGIADAVFTEEKGLLVAVRVADCVPILVAGDGVVGAIHAGWRGVAAGVIGQAVEAMGTGRALLAAVGPCISVDAYEVGEEVVQGILGQGTPEEIFLRRDLGSKAHVDLGAAVVWQLQRAGVSQVHVGGWCTWLRQDLHSFRRDGAASGRSAAIIGQRGEL